MFPRLTDFDPLVARIQFALGKLMPIGVDGEESPDSITTLITLAEIPVTSFFLCSLWMGEWSSNHWALPPMVAMRLVAIGSRI